MTGVMPSMNSHRVRGFDGLRGLAALAVFVEHKVLSGIGLGGLGVMLFFALSGYLIIGILHKQRGRIEVCSSSVREAMFDFWTRRILRIFPLYYLILFLIGAWQLVGGGNLLDAGLHWYAAYVSNFFVAHIAQEWSKFSHLWSLSVEQQFYLAAAPLFLCIPIVLHRNILCITLAASGASLLLSSFLFHNVMAFYLSPLPNFGLMALGGLLALESRKWAWKNAHWNLVLLSGLLMLPFIVGLEQMMVHLEQAGKPAPIHLAALKVLLSYWFAFSTIGYVSNRQDSVATKLLSVRWLTYIGTISYGFYVFHLFPPSYDFVDRALHLPQSMDVIQEYWVVVQFLMTVGIASLSWHFFEEPILRLKDSYWRRKMAMS